MLFRAETAIKLVGLYINRSIAIKCCQSVQGYAYYLESRSIELEGSMGLFNILLTGSADFSFIEVFGLWFWRAACRLPI